MIFNILQNAVKYNKNKGKIQINFDLLNKKQSSKTSNIHSWHQKLLVIYIKDHGIGIEEHRKSILF